MVQHHDPGGAIKPLTQMRALRQTSTPVEAERPSLCIRKLQNGRGATAPSQDATTMLCGE